MATALLDHDNRVLVIRDASGKVLKRKRVEYSEHESIDTWVGRAVRRAGFRVTGDEDHRAGTLYTLRKG